MDSLKIPKAGGSSTSTNTSTSSSGGVTSGGTKPSGNIPITVRFNAGEECIDDLFQSFHNSASNSGSGSGGGAGVGGNSGGGGDSLSSSPSQHHHHHHQQQQQHQTQANVDEVNTRNNFLQGNFFNRKRSGSIEGVSPTTTGPNLITAFSSSAGGGGDTASVGTWKLIKGKVSQTIEDIKSSKSSSNQALPTVPTKGEQPQNEADSDQENTTVNTSISEELPLDQEHKQRHPHDRHHHKTQKGDSGSDVETEVLLEADAEPSRIRRGIANLKSKVKAKSTSSSLHHHNSHHHHASALTTAALSTATLSTAFGTAAIKTMKNDTSPSRSLPSSSTTSVRSGFLRKRRKQPIEGVELATTTAMPDVASGMNEKKKKHVVTGKKEVEIESGVEMLEDTIPAEPIPTNINGTDKSRKDMELPLQDMHSAESMEDNSVMGEFGDKNVRKSDSFASLRSMNLIKKNSLTSLKSKIKTVPLLAIVTFTLILMLPINDFLRGVFACLLCFSILDVLSGTIQRIIGYFLVDNPPESGAFQIPDYSKMSICEIPAVEEHKTVKAYSGWMNEVDSYDPNSFHISMSKSVYVKLEGTILRISTTTSRIPKRAMWNEPPINLENVIFTAHRTYNLLGCRIEMLPLGLARKRYFNRKYPMQLIIKNSPEHRIGDLADNITESFSKENQQKIDPKDSRQSVYFSVQSKTSLQTNSTELLVDDRAEQFTRDAETEIDFAATILNADLQNLQDTLIVDADLQHFSIPCGDEVRLLLFSRGDREKEDWYRRFLAASTGHVHDRELSLASVKSVTGVDLHAAAAKAAILLTDPNYKQKDASTNTSLTQLATTSSANEETTNKTPTPGDNVVPPIVHEGKTEKRNIIKIQATPDTNEDFEDLGGDVDLEDNAVDETFEGLLMSSCAARNPPDYIRFMSLYQKACNQTRIPVLKMSQPNDDEEDRTKKKRVHRRKKRPEDELWKGIDQSLFLGPSGSVVWANVLIGRVLYSCLHDSVVHGKLQALFQRKLSSLKLPSFMEDVIITEINLGNTPPLIHRVSQPMLDERGTWLDGDITYEGLLDITVTTKLNLLRLKRQSRMNLHAADVSLGTPSSGNLPPINVIPDDATAAAGLQSYHVLQQDDPQETLSDSAIFYSDAESSGGSSSDSESTGAGPTSEANANANEFTVFNTSPGNARRIFKIVDRITASNFFQYATELSYVQRAMENMSANITLRVEVKGLVGRGTINIPPPPSDRVWLAFRGPPRLWISAKPTVGDKSFDWTIVTSIIESKLCDQVNKFLVYPNMVDVTIPFLGQPTYKE